MKKIITTFVVAFICVITMRAQNELLAKINEIKAQKDVYYWGQYTHPDENTAFIGAAKRLLIDVNIYRRNKNLPEETVDAILPKIKQIKMNRGNLTRIFAYGKISDLLKDILVDETQRVDVEQNTTNSNSSVAREFVPDAFTQKVLQCKDFQSVYKFLREQKLQGQLLQFGALSEVEEYESLDLILFDLDTQSVLCLLSHVNQMGVRTNLLTGATDSLDNYPEDMVAVIWYIK